MKTSQTEILSSLSELRDYLEESHAGEHQSDHFGDGPDGCSYCRAIARADSILAVSSSPDDSPTLSDKFKLAEFGAVVLEILESSHDWSADTTDEISGEAVKRGLAEASRENGGLFRRVLAPDTSGAEARERAALAMGQAAQASNEAGRAARSILPPRGSCMDQRRAVLVLVVNESGGLVSADIEWSDHPGKRPDVADGWRVEVIPLSLALAAPGLLGIVVAVAWSAEPLALLTTEARKFVPECPARFGGPMPSGWASVDV